MILQLFEASLLIGIENGEIIIDNCCPQISWDGEMWYEILTEAQAE